MKRKIAILAVVFFGILLLVFVVNPYLFVVPIFVGWDAEGMRFDTPFVEAHERAVKTFVESEGFGISRLKKSGLWNERSITFKGGSYNPYKIRLIGTTPEYGSRFFPEGRPPRKKEIAESETRQLAKQELEVIERLKNRESRYEELPLESDVGFDTTRVIAPIFASEDCLTCHAVRVGDMLGAFDYVLIPESTSQNNQNESVEEPGASGKPKPVFVPEPST